MTDLKTFQTGHERNILLESKTLKDPKGSARKIQFLLLVINQTLHPKLFFMFLSNKLFSENISFFLTVETTEDTVF